MLLENVHLQTNVNAAHLVSVGNKINLGIWKTEIQFIFAFGKNEHCDWLLTGV